MKNEEPLTIKEIEFLIGLCRTAWCRAEVNGTPPTSLSFLYDADKIDAVMLKLESMYRTRKSETVTQTGRSC